MNQDYKNFRNGSKFNMKSQFKNTVFSQIKDQIKKKLGLFAALILSQVDLTNFRRQAIRAGVIALTGIITLILIWSGVSGWIENSSWSIIKKVDVSGLVRMDPDDIRKAAKVPLGQNMNSLDLDTIAARVREISAVKLARVIKKIPNRVEIIIEERVPVAVFAGTNLVLVDKEGVVFPVTNSGEVVDLPFITGDVRKIADIPNCAALELLVKLYYNYSDLYCHISEVNQLKGKLEVRLRQSDAVVLVNDIMEEANIRKLTLFLEQKALELSPEIRYVDLTYSDIVLTGTTNPRSNSIRKGN